MKTRPGFVSNSSTTSFCIYGAKTFVDEENYDGDLYTELGKVGLDTHYSEWDGHYIGASWDTIGEDETGAQFKQRVEEEVMKIDPSLEPNAFGTYEEAYRDG